MSDITLKPCPKCGEKNRVVIDGLRGWYYGECLKCRYRTGDYPTIEAAEIGWNRDMHTLDDLMNEIETRMKNGGWQEVAHLLRKKQDQIDALESLLDVIVNLDPSWEDTGAWKVARDSGAFVGTQWEKETS